MNKREIVLLLDNIRSLHNVGSLFRSADAFGVSKIYLCGITGTPDSLSGHKIAKTSLGAEKYIPWEYSKNIKTIIQELKTKGYQIVSLEQTKTSVSLKKVKFKNKVVLVVGNEIRGISKSILNLSDKMVEISMQGKKESLNVSVAGGIALYVLRNN